MKKIKVLALALLCSVFTPSKADEGISEEDVLAKSSLLTDLS